MRFLSIPALVLLLTLPVAGGQPTGKDLIAKFRKAIGADAPTVSTPVVIKYRGHRYLYSVVGGKLQGEAFAFDGTLTGYTDIPQKLRVEMEMKIGIVPFKHVEAVDGKLGWYRDNDSEAVVMSKGLMEGKRQREIHVSVFLGREAFEPDRWQFSEPTSTRVGRQEAWEVVARTSGLEPITLSFAKQSGLLLRLKTKATDFTLLPGAEAKLDTFTRELNFHDWKKFGTRMLPGQLDAFHDGVLWAQMEPVSVSFPKTVDPKLFALPETKK